MMGGKVKTTQDYIFILSPEEVLNVLHSTVGGQVAQEHTTRSTRHAVASVNTTTTSFNKQIIE